jgi:hypothetical protein
MTAVGHAGSLYEQALTADGREDNAAAFRA